MISKISTIMGKLSHFVAKKAGGSGTALPGKVAMKFDKNILSKLSKKL